MLYKQIHQLLNSFDQNKWYCIYTECLNKKETRRNMPVSLKLDKHLNHFGYYLLAGYLLSPTVPTVMSVNENDHFKNRFTFWLCTKMLKLRVIPSLWYLQTFFQIVDFTRTRDEQEIGGQTCFQPPASNLFETIQSQWKLSGLLWATS